MVGQGRELWTAIVAGESTPETAARPYLDGAYPWDEQVTDPRRRGHQSPGFLARGVYRSRFGEDLDERIDHRRPATGAPRAGSRPRRDGCGGRFGDRWFTD
ncbi:hypothetical protein ACFV1L_25225 [Kitasatospora sp. NPDC059646]|uniref:hypothetical protein n=1 Tax=Kitasatospora sp. NPDC059646 TaxID=3346893 RepID=UPI00369B74EE